MIPDLLQNLNGSFDSNMSNQVLNKYYIHLSIFKGALATRLMAEKYFDFSDGYSKMRKKRGFWAH